MSIEHLNAVFNCKEFKNGARLLLLALANRASDGKPRKDGRVVEYGWSYAGIGRLMADINASCRDTVIENMKVLVGARVVKRKRRLGHSTMTFVDIDVLKGFVYTDEDIEEVKRKAVTKVGKATTTGRNVGGKAQHLKNGEFAATDVGESSSTDVGKHSPSDVGITPATVVEEFPTHNQKVNPKYEHQRKEALDVEPSESESELTDTDSDGLRRSEARSSSPTGCCEQGDQEDPDDEEFLSHSGDRNPVSGKGVSPDPETEEPDPEEYKDVVHLCSIWWSTHHNPMDETVASPEPEPDPRGHPRTWSPSVRREAFLNGEWQDDDPNSLELVLPPEPMEEPEAEPEDNSAKVEEALLRDEGCMLDIYLQHGRGVVEDLLVWLPKSDFWYPKIVSLAKLKVDFNKVYESYEKYLLAAEEGGTDIECEDYIYGVFLESGGAQAGSICDERLNPLPPIDPADAAEEEAMYAYDDEHDMEFFDVWAEHDFNDAEATPRTKDPGDNLFDVWAEQDVNDANDALRADESGADMFDPGAGEDDYEDADDIEKDEESGICDEPMKLPLADNHLGSHVGVADVTGVHSPEPCPPVGTPARDVKAGEEAKNGDGYRSSVTPEFVLARMFSNLYYGKNTLIHKNYDALKKVERRWADEFSEALKSKDSNYFEVSKLLGLTGGDSEWRETLQSKTEQLAVGYFIKNADKIKDFFSS